MKWRTYSMKWRTLRVAAVLLLTILLTVGGCGREQELQETPGFTESQTKSESVKETADRTVGETETKKESEKTEEAETETDRETDDQAGRETESQTAATESSQTETVPPSEPETEPPTQPPTQPQTQPPTQPQTQPPTQPQTAPPTQPQTQPPTQPQTAPSVPVSGSRMIAIDPGHQASAWNELEPIGPGASAMKPKTSSGTQGCVTGVAESQLNLTVALKLRDALQARGYQVYMVRTSQDVRLSNKDRADMAYASGAEIFIRIHANGSADPAMNGILTMAPSAGNPYVAHLSASSNALSASIVNHIAANTGQRNIGVLATDDMSGINWSQIPVTIVEMGYMSNPDEDRALNTPSFQDKIVQGICSGVDEYFASH
ncbi:MAG TPA: N-acetylmuramoyl-L-alanine amidase [Candidatus Fimimorpha excrementavium]|nr:N-acetylmuramoyl-L-alanine amidase [Candidatus Fimimorpha excrementavium]